MADLATAVQRQMPQVRDELEYLVRIPSVAFADFPEEPVQQAAQATADILRTAGLEPELRPVPGGAPEVWAERPGPPGAPTVLLYAHYDVQPAGHEDEWESPPWEPTERNGRLYGRGTADDKCGIVQHAAALRALGDDLRVGLKVVIEGGEETGSRALLDVMANEPERLDADVVVVSDAGNWRVGEPTLTTSLRGMAILDVEVRTLRAPVHSGMYGGAVPDALMALTRMLATMLDEHGDVAIPGLGTSTCDGRPVQADVPREDAGMLDGVDFVGSRSIAERLFTRPAVSVVGIDAPAVHGAVNAIQPVARARISARLAPDDDPVAAQRVIASHLEHVAPWGAEVTVTPLMAGPGAWLAGGGGVRQARGAGRLRGWHSGLLAHERATACGGHPVGRLRRRSADPRRQRERGSARAGARNPCRSPAAPAPPRAVAPMTRHLDLEDLWRIPHAFDPQRSPDGECVAYTTEPCSFCSRVKQLLAARGMPFTEVNLAKDADGRSELAARTGMMSFPQVLVGDEVVGGFQETMAADRSGRLRELATA